MPASPEAIARLKRKVDAAPLYAPEAAPAGKRAGIEQRAATALAPVLLDLRVLAATDPQPPRFIVEGWLPEGQATLFAGHGGAGKSLLALTVAICIAAGRTFFGLRCERRRVLLVSYEDGADVLHWRLRRVCAMLGINLESLAGWLLVFDASAVGEALYVETRDGHGPTLAFDWLREQVAATAAQVLVLDGTADAFGGNENARAQVRSFVQSLRRLMPADGAVLLLHHVDASTAHSGSGKGYSGSTAWHNSCRARWYLRPEAEGDDADPSRVVLELRKSNHAKPGASLALRFNDSAGCFVTDCEAIASSLDRALRDSHERAAVLGLIRAADAAGDPLPASYSGQRTAYTVAKARADFPASLRGKTGRARFFEHIESLRQAGAVSAVEQRKSNRHVREVLRAIA
jgi:RecA-family ATPase